MDTNHIPDARLAELLSENTARPEDLAHVRECPQCAEKVAAMKRMAGMVERFRGRVPPEVVARFQERVHQAMERGGATAAASANVDAMFSSLLGGSAPATPPASASPPAGSASTGTMPAPFDPPEPPSPMHARRSRRDDAIEHITMPSGMAGANVPAPYDSDAGSGLLERLGLKGRRLFVLVLLLLGVAFLIAFALRRHG